MNLHKSNILTIVKKILILLFAAVAFVGCETYDDLSNDNFQKYIEEGVESIDATKAIEILSEGRGFWRVNGNKSYVRLQNADGTSKLVPYYEHAVARVYFIYEFEDDGTTSAYGRIYNIPATTILNANVDWARKTIKVGDFKIRIKGVTESYLILEQDQDGFVSIDVYERLSDADVVRWLGQTQFDDQRE